MIITYYSKGKDQPDKVANSARGQLNRENAFFPVCLRSRLKIWSRQMGLVVASRVSLLVSILRLNLVLTCRISSRVLRRCQLLNLKRHTPLGQSRVYRVTQLPTDGVHCL